MSVRRSLSLAAALILLVAFVASIFRHPETELAFLSVGQGDCGLFLSAGKAVMIDTGPESADKLVLPELRRRGVRRLDLVLLSHPDADHIAALPAIAKRIKIVRVVVPAYFRGHPDIQRTFKDAGIEDAHVAWLAGPSDARIGDFTLHLDVPPWEDGMPDNDGSMMVHIANGTASALFTGDAGFQEEIQMLHKGSWNSQILKLGHHGSRFSTCDSWLDSVHPEIAIVSCGRDNSYGHPTQEVLDKCASRHISVMRTDTEGTLSFRLVDGKWVRR